jgi:hypothetical protein
MTRAPKSVGRIHAGWRLVLTPKHLLLFCSSVVAACLAVQALAGQTKPEESVRDQFLGAWRLVSVETIRANGDIVYPFYGKHPQGMIVYDRSGWMSVQIVSDPRPTVPAADTRESFATASAQEKAVAIDGYYAYCGTWSVDAAKSTVTHQITQSLYPAEWGEQGVRHFVFDGDRLTLSAKTHEMGEDHERKLVWQRIWEERP